MECRFIPCGERAADRRFAALLTAVYGAWVIFVCVHHEPWRDEADVWLATRDMSLGQLLHWLGASGSPGLWYLLVMPLAKLGFPYRSMMALHAPLAIAGAGIVAFWAPFPRLFKVGIVFSYSLLFEYAVVARSYVLTALLLFLIAALLSSRVKRPVILGIALFLLFNANVHGFFIAGAILATIAARTAWRREFSRPTIIGMAIAALGALLSFVQLLSPSQVPSPTVSRRWPVCGYILSETFLPHLPKSREQLLAVTGGRDALTLLGLLAIRFAGAMVFVAVLCLMRRSRMALAIVIPAWMALTYVCVFKWFQDERHAGLFFLIAVFGLWVSDAFSRAEPQSTRREFGRRIDAACRGVLAAGLCVSCAVGVLWSFRQLRSEYSGANDAAAFIRNEAPANLPIAVCRGLQAEAIIPYLPSTQFWFAGRHDFGTYTHWDGNWRADDSVDETEALRRIHRQFPTGNYLLLISSHPLANSAEYRLVFQNRHEVFGHADEVYYLYAPRPEFARKPTQADTAQANKIHKPNGPIVTTTDLILK